MSNLKFSIDENSALPDKPLSDAGLEVKIAGATAFYDKSFSLSGIDFGLGMEGNAIIEAFNAPNDPDPEGVLGNDVTDHTGFGDVIIPPQIKFSDEAAWLKYSCLANAKVKAGGTVSPVMFKIDGSKAVIFADYHTHSRTENTQSAVLSDLADLRIAAKVDDIKKLQIDEALLYMARGELTSSITLTWSDIITSSLSSLTQFLNYGEMLSIHLTPSASVTFNIGLEDDFRIVFSRVDKDTVRVALKKCDSIETGLKTAVSVTVKFADETAIQNALNQFFESVAGSSLRNIDDIFAKASFDQLNAAERQLADELISRLGLKESVSTLNDLSKQWKALKQQIEETIKQIAKAKVECGFSYEYLRVKSEDALLIVDLDETQVGKFHNDFMVCEFRNVLNWVQDNPDALQKYLHQNQYLRKQAWGFTLGVGPWQLSGKDKKELIIVEQENEKKYRRIAYKGLRSYEEDLVGNKAKWWVDFKAEMPDFSKDATPFVHEFRYGLHFCWNVSQKKLTQNELYEYLDLAVIWRIISISQVGKIIRQLKDNLTHSTEISIQFLIDDEIFRILMKKTASDDQKEMIVRGLSRGLPYVEAYFTRRNPLLRELVYSPLWRYYLDNDDRDIGDYSKEAAYLIAKITELDDEFDLSKYERIGAGDRYTFAGQIFENGKTSTDFSGIHEDWKDFITGANLLDSGLDASSPKSYKIIESSFKKMSAFWDQSLKLRAIGVYLIELAHASNVLKKIQRSCSIKFDNKEVITFSSNT